MISQLDFQHLWALCHVLSSIFIFLCLLSVISVLFGDYLLKYFNIENKYPRLGRYIKIRRMYQQFYLILNIILYALGIIFFILLKLEVVALLY